MQKRLSLALLLGGLVAPFSASAQIYNYFGTGTIRSGVTTGSTTSTSKEQNTSSKQVFGGSAFTATGENVTVMSNGPYGPLGPGSTFTIVRPGEPWQFSTTYKEPGLTSIETGGRTVTTQTLTNSLSVFSEIQ